MNLTGKHIFIVEDNVQNSVIMKVLLEASGAKVSQDRFGTNTIVRMKEAGQIDLVILDLMLAGGRSGYDVFDDMHADPELANTPVVIVSASDPAIEMKKARQKGLQGFISKPIQNHTFSRNIASVLRGDEVWDDE